MDRTVQTRAQFSDKDKDRKSAENGSRTLDVAMLYSVIPFARPYYLRGTPITSNNSNYTSHWHVAVFCSPKSSFSEAAGTL